MSDDELELMPPDTGHVSFSGYPYSNLNADKMIEQGRPFWYKIVRHDKIVDRIVRECATKTTHKRLYELVRTGLVTVVVSPTRPARFRQQKPRR